MQILQVRCRTAVEDDCGRTASSEENSDRTVLMTVPMIILAVDLENLDLLMAAL
jgi:hypothetical protein